MGKRYRISYGAKQLLDSQEILSSMQLISYIPWWFQIA